MAQVTPLDGRRVVLGVSGGIAAYKAVEVCRRLVDAGAHVTPVLTRGALRFVGATTFSALASEPAHTSLFDDADPIPHTRLGQQADLVVVAPATARVLAAYAHGLSNDLLVATLIATRAPVLLCPAMHTEMWEHPAVQDNLALLRSRGVHVVAPEEGRLAGGDIGSGRLAAPERIVSAATTLLTPGDLAGLRVLVTAGGTREPIDPVRFIGNRSSGKQGHAVADAASERGAEVVLVTTTDRPAPPGARRIQVATAQEMFDAVSAEAALADVVVMAAAVADFRPASPAASKIKKGGEVPTIVLEPAPDILATLGEQRARGVRHGQTLVGFAAETEDLVEHASAKLARKGLDLIVANDVSAPGAGFEHDTNEVTILTASGREVHLARRGKDAVAAAILDEVLAERRAASSPTTGEQSR